MVLLTRGPGESAPYNIISMAAQYTPQELLVRFREYLPVLDFLSREKAVTAAFVQIGSSSDGYFAPLSTANDFQDPEAFRADWAVMDKHYAAFTRMKYGYRECKPLSAYNLAVTVHNKTGLEVVQTIGLPAVAYYFTQGDTQARFWLRMEERHGLRSKMLNLIIALQELHALLKSFGYFDKYSLVAMEKRLRLVHQDTLAETGYHTGPVLPVEDPVPLPKFSAEVEAQRIQIGKAFIKVVKAIEA